MFTLVTFITLSICVPECLIISILATNFLKFRPTNKLIFFFGSGFLRLSVWFYHCKFCKIFLLSLMQVSFHQIVVNKRLFYSKLIFFQIWLLKNIKWVLNESPKLFKVWIFLSFFIVIFCLFRLTRRQWYFEQYLAMSL